MALGCIRLEPIGSAFVKKFFALLAFQVSRSRQLL
jgi:hypothetical protein